MISLRSESVDKFSSMKFVSVSEYAAKYGLTERTVRNYCTSGKIAGAFQTARNWNIPEDAVLPVKGRHSKKMSPLLERLTQEMEAKVKGGIYHRTQIDLTYNSNHIEGSRLTHDQTRYIYETQTIGVTTEAVRVDDIIETINHFKAIDTIILRAQERLGVGLIKELHSIIKSGTADSRKDWFAVGDYKKLPNEVGGIQTTPPEDVAREMNELLKWYDGKSHKTLDDLLDFHYKFERIHPFQDGNGRIGRLILFKECLANNVVPFIITDELKNFYYRGLQNWPQIQGYLRDTCLTAQDNYKDFLNYFRINY